MAFREPASREEPTHSFVHDLARLVRINGPSILSDIVPIRSNL